MARGPGTLVFQYATFTTPGLNITIQFTTKAANGVLLYYGQQQRHLAVEVFKGRLRISYHVGNNPASTMFR